MICRFPREIWASRLSSWFLKSGLTPSLRSPSVSHFVTELPCLPIKVAMSQALDPYREAASVDKTIRPRVWSGERKPDAKSSIVYPEASSNGRPTQRHVICGSRDRQARMSWHGIPCMRGRDNPILRSSPHKSKKFASRRAQSPPSMPFPCPPRRLPGAATES